MKSIVEEASSVVKAIEKGWVQAGKPQEFSIKVFEAEQKNFLGMTTKSAKIAIFYGEQRVNNARHEAHDRRTSSTNQQHPRKQARPAHQPKARDFAPEPAHEQARPAARAHTPAQVQERTPKEAWTDEMVKSAEHWLRDTLRLMNLSHRSFTTESKNYYLKFNFNGPLIDDAERERLLFRSLAHLVMQTLRNKFKKGFRGFKIILNSRP
jgi:predicted RNA-binding protein Jag